MPLEDGLLIACKHDVVELTATLVTPHLDPPDAFGEAVAARLVEHRHLAMTDPAILEGDGLGLASVVVSRDPLTSELKDVLVALGFVPEDTETGGRARPSFFGRMSRGRRSKLDRWRLDWVRAEQVSPEIGAFEDALVDLEDPFDSLESAVEAVRMAARTALGVLAPPTLEGLGQLETALDLGRSARLVLHPSAVRALSAFVTQTILASEPRAVLDPEANPPLVVPVGSGVPVGTDPEFRVIEHVRRGKKASLVQYVRLLRSEAEGALA